LYCVVPVHTGTYQYVPICPILSRCTGFQMFNYFNTIISIFFLVSIISIISIKTLLWHFFLIKCIVSLISFDVYYINFFFLFLLCQLLLLKHIMTLLKQFFYSGIFYALCLSMYIMSIIFMTNNYFNCFQLFHTSWNNWYNSTVTTSPCRTPCCTVPSTLFAFITYRGTIPMPMSWHTTSCIRLRNPAGGRQALLESECAGGGEWFRCPRLEQQAVFPGYFQLEWCR
jgi:hypothetical protein